jgi:HEAT repeat protein
MFEQMNIRFHPDRETILKILETSTISKKLKILDRLNGTNEKDTIKILIKILEDTSWCMREKAAYKLASYGTRVIPRLKNLCRRGHWYTRAAACLSLGEIGDTHGLEPVVDLFLNDANPTVIKEANQALHKIFRRMPDACVQIMKTLNLNADQTSRILKCLDQDTLARIKSPPDHG